MLEAYRSTCWLTVRQHMLANCRTTILSRHIGPVPVKISADILVDNCQLIQYCRPIYRVTCRPTYWQSIGQYVDGHSTDMSVDMLPDISGDMSTNVSVEHRSVCRPTYQLINCRSILYVDRYISRGMHKIHMIPIFFVSFVSVSV